MSDHVDGAVSALREANPVPNPEGFRRSMADPEVFLHDLRVGNKGRSRVAGEQLVSPLEMPPAVGDRILKVTPGGNGPARWLRPGAVAAGLLAVVAVGALILFQTTDDATVADQPVVTAAPQRSTDSVVVPATAFLDAFATFDVDRAISHLAEDADITGIVEVAGDPTVTGTIEELQLFVSWLEAIGYQQQPNDRCKAAASRQLRCSFDFNLLRSDEVLRGPYRGSYFDFTVRDREIVLASMHLATDQFSSQMWEPFAAWVSAEHPEDAAVMYVDGTFSGVRLTEESIQLWEQHSRIYVEEMAPRVAADTAAAVGIAETLMEARNTYDAEVAMSLVADGPVTVQLMHDNRLHPNMGPVELTGNELALAFEAERILGVRYDGFECSHDVQPVSSWQLDRTNVTCTYTMDSRLRRIAGMAPLESSFGFRIRDGHIDLLSFPWINTSFPGFPAELGDFVRWLETEHPEALPEPIWGGADGQVIRFLGGQELSLTLTPHSLDLLAGYLDEYERFVNR